MSQIMVGVGAGVRAPEVALDINSTIVAESFIL